MWFYRGTKRFFLLLVLFQWISFTRYFSVTGYLQTPLPIYSSFFRKFRSSSSPSSPSSSLSATVSTKNNNIFNENDSDRLKKAKLRLAEVQGILPFGSSDLIIQELLTNKNRKEGGGGWNATASSMINTLLNTASLSSSASVSGSKVREISWRVAEPEIQYDPIYASKQLMQQPLVWITRNIQIFVPITIFTMKIITDILQNKEEERREIRAKELLKIISSQSPALIKAGQALASRPDLLPKAYLDALQQLQDRCPAYSNEQAFELFSQETGYNFFDIFELDTPNPIAAASIGQVYKGRLKSNGAQVAIKIQRPKCEESVAVDLFVMRWYASNIQQFLYKLLKRNLDLTSVIDDFGELLYREIDYRAEAINAQRFAELYSSLPDIFVPKVYTNLSTRKVLTMEWVDGARLSDAKALEKMGLDGTKLVDILVECSLRQMLDNGFFHADPHAGNLLAMANGKLCYLDFGMVSYVEAPQRYSIIEAVVHMVNRDFNALAELYRRMGFIPSDVDTAPIVEALNNALPDVLNAPVGEFNFKNVISKLGDVMYKFPFSLPPFYIAIIRCLGVLEGLAIQVDKDFRIINDAYPYIASRLLTDPSEELQSALQQLLFKDGKLRWDRLENLLSKANLMTDYDNVAAIDQLIKYIISPAAKVIRDNIATEIISIFDTLETETVELFLVSTGSVDGNVATIDWSQTIFNLWNILQQYILTNPPGGVSSNSRTSGSQQQQQGNNNDLRLDRRVDSLIDNFIRSIEEREKLKEKLLASNNLKQGITSGSNLEKVIQENQENIDSMRSFLRIVNILRVGNSNAPATGNGALIVQPAPPSSSSSSSSALKKNSAPYSVNPARRRKEGANSATSTTVFLRKIIREPVLQELIGRVISEISQRLATKTIRRVFGRAITAASN